MRIRITGLLTTIVACGITATALAQDNNPPGTGILCSYDIIAAILVDAELCGWIETDRGQAVKQVFADTGAYILANDSSYPERVAEKQAGVARALTDWVKLSEAERASFCAGTNSSYPNYFIGMRSIEAHEWLKASHEMLSVPAQPTYGVCF